MKWRNAPLHSMGVEKNSRKKSEKKGYTGKRMTEEN